MGHGDGVSELDRILAQAREMNISDVHLKEGLPPVFRTSEGLSVAPQAAAWSKEILDGVCRQALGEKLYAQFVETGEADTAYQGPVPAVGRVRVNAYKDRGRYGMALRLIPLTPPRLGDLSLPSQLTQLAGYPDGLVIVAGPTGSGKSTTLAGVISEVNDHRSCHVVTIEDPIEYVHENRTALITQREVGTDTVAYAAALKSVLRQDPDVIVIGEVRDKEVMKIALAASETGHLVFMTLHAVSARECLARILEMFQHEEHNQVRHALAGVLRAIVCQRILPRADGEGRTVVQEIMFQTGRVSDAVSDAEKTPYLDEIIAESAQAYGMQTFNQALAMKVAAGDLTSEVALRISSNQQDLRLMLQQVLGHDPTKVDSGQVDIRLG